MLVICATHLATAQTDDQKKSDSPPAETTGDQKSLQDLYETGKSLFDQFAPPEIKDQYEFPTKEQWDEFVTRLQVALDNNDLAQLAAYLPEAKAALATLRVLPGYEDYADWLQERIDYVEAAQKAAQEPGSGGTPLPGPSENPAPKTNASGVAVTPTTPTPQPVETPAKPTPQPGASTIKIPYYELWIQRMSDRPMPERAERLLPEVQAAFKAEGVPVELAWIAEAESTFNPNARSPSGAKGLFQMMPDTAKNLGLSTFLPDERTDASKSARAAAKYLRTLHDKFGEWPLAFAAYNAGEGRVAKLLKQRGSSNFAGIASALPSETRMYVPKVCATIAVRTGMTPEKIPAPHEAG
jgi:membrane-bound lytic murein transglycosylase D